jgi:hypothetical protein
MTDMPDVKNALIDERRKITYVIMAYRRLTKEEMKSFVGVCLQDKKVRKLAIPGATVKLVSTFR